MGYEMKTEQIENIKKDFWKDLATGGMTASTPDQAPEGYADWQVDPQEALEWFIYRMNTLISHEREEEAKRITTQLIEAYDIFISKADSQRTIAVLLLTQKVIREVADEYLKSSQTTPATEEERE